LTISPFQELRKLVSVFVTHDDMTQGISDFSAPGIYSNANS